MTDVFVTRTGAKYHATYECAAILDAEVENDRSIERWPTPLRNLQQEPCAVCWPRTGSWDAWTQLEHRVEQAGGAAYELVFVRQVLRHVRGLRAHDVSVQRDATGRSGKRYRLDFAIQGEGDLRVAVEIDGKDKAPGERSPDDVKRRVDTRRADLLDAGWRVVNLSNERVANRSAECIVEIESELREPLRPSARDPHPMAVPVAPVGTPGPQTSGPSSPVQTTSRGPRLPILWVAIALAAAVAVGLWVAGVPGGGDGVQDPIGSSCPASAPVKGNLSQEGEEIYHKPGWRYYDRTVPEECFASPEQAEKAGYRPSEVQ